MPIRDTAAQNASLDNDYGTTRGPNAAATHACALFIGDPMTTGVEVAGSGYSRVNVPAAQWAAASAGYKALTAPVQFPAPTAGYPGTVTHWALYAGGVMWDCGPLSDGLDMTSAASVGPLVIFAIYYNDAVTES